MTRVPKYSAFSIDYNGKCYRVGQSDNRLEAIKIALRAFRESKGEYPCFVEDGEKVIFNKRNEKK